MEIISLLYIIVEELRQMVRGIAAATSGRLELLS
jgi:hypothetical protein